MSETKSVKRIARTVVFAILGVGLVVVLLIGPGEGRPPAAQRPGDSSGPVEPAAQGWASCTIENVAVYPQRVHVKCVPPVPTNIYYLAVPTTNAAHSARMLSVLSTALVAGRPLDVLYDPDNTSNLPPGCLVGDCRLLVGASMD
jgi:hypothetical protein